MGLIKKYNIKGFLSLVVLCLLLGSSISLIAQTTDTAAATKADTAIAAPAAKPTSAPLISTAVDTAKSAAATVVGAEADHSAVYKSAWFYVLLFLLLCVFIGIVGKILKVYELSREMQGKKAGFDWQKVQGVLFAIALVLGLYGVYWSYTVQGAMSVTESASVHGEGLDFMFMVTTIITTIVFVLTHIFLFGFSFKYRGSVERKAYFYPHNNAVERIWTIVPAIALTVLVLLGFFTWRGITSPSEAEQKKAVLIEVRGEQFKWNIRYSGSDNQVGVSNYKLITPTNGLGIDFKDRKSWDDKLAGEIVIPVNRPTRVMIGSKDVLHSFYIPDFRVQMNAVPGMPTFFQFTPKYTTAQMREKLNDPKFDFVLLCAKICGSGHYNMQSKVTVVSEAEYAAWEAKLPVMYNDDVKKELQMAEAKASGLNNKVALNTNNNR
ncbi:cytochrome c oxidase subunit II [Flavihumibacter sp. R14]|nr:cytochrome c oxidase subunit II [Flavihumibacter soli]